MLRGMSGTNDTTALLRLLEAEVLPAFQGLDLSDPGAAAAKLSEALPLEGDVLSRVRSLVFEAADAGVLTPKEAGGVRFGRLAKDAQGHSIDAVEMDGPGPKHCHPNGEIDLCFTLDGEPQFCGHAPGWSVFGPGSVHVPTVTGGSMRILYFLPGGAIDFSVA